MSAAGLRQQEGASTRSPSISTIQDRQFPDFAQVLPVAQMRDFYAMSVRCIKYGLVFFGVYGFAIQAEFDTHDLFPPISSGKYLITQSIGFGAA